jgi:hypothetical protein
MPPEEFQTSAHADASGGSEAKPPPLVALFLIKFDLKVGYVSDVHFYTVAGN